MLLFVCQIIFYAFDYAALLSPTVARDLLENSLAYLTGSAQGRIFWPWLAPPGLLYHRSQTRQELLCFGGLGRLPVRLFLDKGFQRREVAHIIESLARAFCRVEFEHLGRVHRGLEGQSEARGPTRGIATGIGPKADVGVSPTASDRL